mmetsp:Transcript_27684/g.49146  ORF Transcript_27684/g.49146 Transcript_27684/m.49146 type:complete len:119 (+) Transcript_27684:340-696(+)
MSCRRLLPYLCAADNFDGGDCRMTSSSPPCQQHGSVGNRRPQCQHNARSWLCGGFRLMQSTPPCQQFHNVGTTVPSRLNRVDKRYCGDCRSLSSTPKVQVHHNVDRLTYNLQLNSVGK